MKKFNDNNLVVFYHNQDFDGFCCGFLFKELYPNATYVGLNYNDNIQIPLKNKDVVMCDISLSMVIMEGIANISKSFTWIDHHASKKLEFENHFTRLNKIKINYIYNANISACLSTFQFLYGEITNIPESISLLSLYDTWNKNSDYDWKNDILAFQYGMQSLCNNFSDFCHYMPLITMSNKTNILNIIKKSGIDIIQYIDKQNERDCKMNCFEAMIKGTNLRALCLNTTNSSIETFKGFYDEKNHDLVLCFSFNGTLWKISFRTTKENVDLSQLAKKYGGGGHKKASGCTVANLKEIF